MGKNNIEDCFCAFCKHERKIYTKKHVSLTNVLVAALFSIFVNGVLWSLLDPKAAVTFIVILMLSEVLIQVRWRLSLPCPYCSFDPIQYLKDPKAMAQKVKMTLEYKGQDPVALLSRKNPMKNLTPLRTPDESPGLSKRV